MPPLIYSSPGVEEASKGFHTKCMRPQYMHYPLRCPGILKKILPAECTYKGTHCRPLKNNKEGPVEMAANDEKLESTSIF